MKLDAYLALPGAPSQIQFAAQVGIGTVVTLRNWLTEKTVPEPQFIHAIYCVTGKRVKAWDVRPKDWWQLRPDLIGAEGAPPVNPKFPPAWELDEDRQAADTLAGA